MFMRAGIKSLIIEHNNNKESATHTGVFLDVDAGMAMDPRGPWALDGRIVCVVVFSQPFNGIARSTSQVLHPLHNVLTGVHVS